MPLDLISAATLAPHPVQSAPVRECLLRQYPLRDYQFDVLMQAATLMRLGYRRVLIQLPTGAGKTVLAAALLGGAATLEVDSRFVVHRKELIDQTSQSFARFAIDHGFIAAGRPFDPAPLVHLAGVQTLVNRLAELLPSDLTVIDEAQHATAASWAQVMAATDGFVLGLSATPERLDGRGLDDHFDAMVIGPDVATLIRRGFLSPFDYYAPSTPDLSDVHTVAGEFHRGELNSAVDRPTLIGDIVEHYLDLARGDQGIVFAASREHSRHLAEAFAGEGVPAGHVDGAMSDRERAHRVDAFKSGDLRVMTNVDLFGEGFDVPGIVYVGLARPTKSLSLHRQQCGRALRVLPGKERAIICDHAGNAMRLSDLPDTPRTWSLSGRPKRNRGAEASDVESVRQCLACYRISYSTVRTCPGCGTRLAADARAEIREEQGKLSKIDREILRKAAERQRKEEERSCKSYGELVSLAEARSYRNPEGWARMKMKFRSSYRR